MNITTNPNDLQFSSAYTRRLFRSVLISTRKDKSYLKHQEEQKILNETNPLIDTFAQFNNVRHHSQKKACNINRQLVIKNDADSNGTDFSIINRDRQYPHTKQKPKIKLKGKNNDSLYSNLKQEPNIKVSSSNTNYHSIFISYANNLGGHVESTRPIKQEPADEYEDEILPNIVKDAPHEIKVEQPLYLSLPLDNEVIKATQKLPESYDAKIEIKEEFVDSLVTNKVKVVYKPKKNKEFTGFTLFSLQQRTIIKNKKPTAHYMEIYHVIHKQWAHLTIAAKRDLEQKATQIMKKRNALLCDDTQEDDVNRRHEKETPSQFQERRQLQLLRHRQKRANERLPQTRERRLVEGERLRNRGSSESIMENHEKRQLIIMTEREEVIKNRKRKAANRQRQRRADETLPQTRERRQLQKERQRQRRSNESLAQTRERRRLDIERQRDRRSNETIVETQQRKRLNAERQIQGRINGSNEYLIEELQ